MGKAGENCRILSTDTCGFWDYPNFEGVIERAKVACKNSGQTVENHFGEVTDMVAVDKGTQRLTRTQRIELRRFGLEDHMSRKMPAATARRSSKCA